jgi:hypothetical protein
MANKQFYERAGSVGITRVRLAGSLLIKSSYFCQENNYECYNVVILYVITGLT